MVLSDDQKKQLERAIESIEYGEIIIKAQGHNSFIDIIESRRKRIYNEEEKNYHKG